MYNRTSAQTLGKGRATYGFTGSPTRTRSTSISSLHTPATNPGRASIMRRLVVLVKKYGDMLPQSTRSAQRSFWKLNDKGH
jgi:hypothetical protein